MGPPLLLLPMLAMLAMLVRRLPPGEGVASPRALPLFAEVALAVFKWLGSTVVAETGIGAEMLESLLKLLFTVCEAWGLLELLRPKNSEEFPRL